jgi:hypothetical protein
MLPQLEIQNTSSGIVQKLIRFVWRAPGETVIVGQVMLKDTRLAQLSKQKGFEVGSRLFLD